MDYLNSNLDLLSRRQPALARLLSAASLGPIELLPTASGVPTARCHGPASTVLLHSGRDPMKEARSSLAGQHLPTGECYALLGFGLGYVLDALLEMNRGRSAGYFVVESNLEILRAAFEARDMRGVLSLPQLHFAWPPAGPELCEQWRQFFDPVTAEKCTFVMHPPSIARAPALFKSAAEIIQSESFQILTDINTLVARSEEFLRNFVENLPRALGCPGVSGFAGAFTGVPGLIVSAGPSLDRNVHELRGWEEQVLVLSTDTALKPLLAAGIEPHFVLTADPGHRNFLHVQGAVTRRALLVAEATAYPAVFAEFPGRVITCTFRDSSLRALSDVLAEKGSLKAWGSVATMALDFALHLGCNPVIFAGQDLAHSDGRTYCTGLFTEGEWFADIADPQAWASRWERLREGHKIVVTDDLFGRPIETTDKLAAYWNWMVKEIGAHPGTRFINATEGGILRQGVEILSLREALHRYCALPLALLDRVRTLYGRCAQDPGLGDRGRADFLVEEAARLERAVQEGLALARRTPAGPSPALLATLEKAKQSVYSGAPQLASLLDAFNQMGNVAFLRGRNRLTQTPKPSAVAIQSVYGEYFASVGEALRRVAPGLQEIRRALGAAPRVVEPD